MRNSQWYDPFPMGYAAAYRANDLMAKAIVSERRSLVAKALCREFGFKGSEAKEVAKLLYLQGKLPNNFPVPSINGHVQITAHAVYIANPQGWDNIRTIK